MKIAIKNWKFTIALLVVLFGGILMSSLFFSLSSIALLTIGAVVDSDSVTKK